ncbi:MAG: hypothetical protein HYV07_20395, partial [Deltaproteobacteria bacterium]|nr:hypothetical protein [Deltaproteobacteria bacterium]
QGLRALRLEGDAYVPVLPTNGRVTSQNLGLDLGVVEGQLRFFDASAGMMLPTKTELLAAETARADAERARAEAERTRADAERTRADAERTRAEREAEAKRAAVARVAELEALLAGRG